jgi:hypothetical protein
MADERDRLRRLRQLEAEQAAAQSNAGTTPAGVDPYYVRDPKTGLSPAQVEANQAVADAVAASGGSITKGATGPDATSDRITFTAEQLKKKREEEYFAAQAAAKGTKPTPPPADEQYVYDYVWRQDVGGPGGNWVLVKSPNTGPADWKFDSNGMLFYKGKAFTGTYQGVQYVDGKGPGYKESGSGNKGGPTGTPTTTYTAPDGKIFTDLNAYNAYIAQTAADAKRKAGQSAYDILFGEFERYGMGSLLNDVKEFIVQGLSRDELLLKLRGTSAYGQRFAANAQRVKAGLRALSEAEYVGLEDAYQQKMREYGLPASYYTRGDLGRQVGFEKFIAGDVSPAELEDRIQTAQNRVNNAPKQVRDALSQFYGAELGNGDILAYVLDTENALPQIKRKVTAAEIGAGAMQAGLATTRERAEELGAFGVTAQQAREGFQTIGGFLPRATQLSEIYAKQGEGPFTQTTAEQEVFGTTGAVEAQRKRRKLAELETAQFSGTTGAAGGALARERAGQF